MWHGGRWGREKADIGVEESKTKRRRRAGQRGNDLLARRNGVALGDSVYLWTPHVRDTHASFPFSLSLQSLPLFFSFPPASFPSLSFSLPLDSPILAEYSSTLRLPRSVLPCTISLRSPPGRRRLEPHVVRALPPLAELGAAPIGAPLPATTALQSAYGADG